MNIVDVEREMAWLDAVYRPVVTSPVDVAVRDDPDAWGAAVKAELDRLAVYDRAEAAVRAVVAVYAAGDETVRAAVRRLFDRYTSFRWAAHLPREWDTAEEFRAHLIHLSARDQGADTRDEILGLRDLCERALGLGIDTGPILDEVAAMSSDEDRYGMGSMRSVLLAYGQRGAISGPGPRPVPPRRAGRAPSPGTADTPGSPGAGTAIRAPAKSAPA